jgi:hypothetical protein
VLFTFLLFSLAQHCVALQHDDQRVSPAYFPAMRRCFLAA